MGSWWYGHLYWFYYFLHFDLSEIIAVARYLPVTPALPVTSETCPLPLDYSKFHSKSLIHYYLLYTTGIRCYYCFNLWHISVTGSDRTGAPHKTHYGQHTYNTLFAQPCLQYLQYLQYFTSYHWLSACHLKNFKVVLLLTGSICWIMFVK